MSGAMKPEATPSFHEYDAAISRIRAMHARITLIISLYYGDWYSKLGITSFHVKDGMVYARTDNHFFPPIPVEWVHMDDKKLMDIIGKEKAEREKKYKQEQQESERKKKEARRARFLKLKKEFETT